MWSAGGGEDVTQNKRNSEALSENRAHRTKQHHLEAGDVWTSLSEALAGLCSEPGVAMALCFKPGRHHRGCWSQPGLLT